MIVLAAILKLLGLSVLSPKRAIGEERKNTYT